MAAKHASIMPSVASLMSPPEATPLESFARATPMSTSNSNSTASTTSNKNINSCNNASKPVFTKPLPSPPVSPYVRNAPVEEPVVGAQHQLVVDPVLYPSSQETITGPASPPRPLFVDDEEAAAAQKRIVEEHIAARKLDTINLRLGTASPPQKEDYELMLNFTSRVMAAFKSSPVRWHARELEYLREDQRQRARANPSSTTSRPLLSIAPRPAKTFGPKPVARSPIAKPQRAPRSSASKPARKPRDSSTPEPGRNATAAAARTVSTREDKDFEALADFCPPLSTLPDRPNSLKVEWKGAPLDLRADPHRHLLHDDELLLAANLRLDCATYLTSKRRIFIARVRALEIGKEFRKTDSQQACKIDVNKASKLWMAFDKVGWLKAEHVMRFARQA